MAENGSATLLSSMRRLFRVTRTLFLLVLVALLAGSAACLTQAGHMLVDPAARETPREADAIVVLSGAPADRWLEAYELWREKRAPRIVLSHGYRDGGSLELQRRGIAVPTDGEIGRGVMIEKLGVPPEAILDLPGRHDNTAAEASTALAVAREHGWRRIIVVTSLAHTRRTALAMKRVLEPAGIAVQVRGSRFDAFQPARWWRSRASTRWVLAEWPKLVAYRLGMGK